MSPLLRAFNEAGQFSPARPRGAETPRLPTGVRGASTGDSPDYLSLPSLYHNLRKVRE
jgi:hypothetical protein